MLGACTTKTKQDNALVRSTAPVVVKAEGEPILILDIISTEKRGDCSCSEYLTKYKVKRLLTGDTVIVSRESEGFYDIHEIKRWKF